MKPNIHPPISRQNCVDHMDLIEPQFPPRPEPSLKYVQYCVSRATLLTRLKHTSDVSSVLLAGILLINPVGRLASQQTVTLTD